MSCGQNLLNQQPDVIDEAAMNVVTPKFLDFQLEPVRVQSIVCECVCVCKGQTAKGKPRFFRKCLSNDLRRIFKVLHRKKKKRDDTVLAS